MAKAPTPRTYVLDPDHPAFLVMDEGHCQWLHQLEGIWPGFFEPEGNAFRRAQFRREWTNLGPRFELLPYLDTASRHSKAMTPTEWCFLLRAWLTHEKPSALARGKDVTVIIRAFRLITSALDDQSLRAIRTTDPDLYREFSIDLWSALSQRCKFEDRFQYHPGGGGMRQAFMNVEIANFDRFLLTWPIQTDWILAPIRTEVKPWWEEWREWIQKKQSRG